jgi:hypothetical protein
MNNYPPNTLSCRNANKTKSAHGEGFNKAEMDTGIYENFSGIYSYAIYIRRSQLWSKNS